MQNLGYKPLSSYYVKLTNGLSTYKNSEASQDAPTKVVPQRSSQSYQKQNVGYKNSSQSGQTQRPSAEKYRQIRQQQGQTNTGYKSSSSSSAQNKRPSAEKYRQMRQSGQVKN